MIAVTVGDEAYRCKRPAASSAEPPTMTSTTIEPQATTLARPAGPRDASRSSGTLAMASSCATQFSSTSSLSQLSLRW
jgi:hypothetical protein